MKERRKVFNRISVICCAVVAVLVVFVGWLLSMTGTKWSGDSDVRIYLPKGISIEGIEDTLKTHFGDDYAQKTMRLWRWQGGKVANAEGSYVVSPSLSALRLSRKLLYGRQDPVKVTFNNVRTLNQLADRVSQYLEIDSDAFLAGCDSVLPSNGFDKANYVAAFLPDTYEFYWNAPASKVVEKMLEVRNGFWNDERRTKAKALGLKPTEVAVVASIVEEETGKRDERPMVARLYLNRIDKRMLLQADPTVKFAVGDFSIRRITGKHLAVESPYNTYKHAGLPPGPIRVAEAATLDDVLNAPKHDYLYMCAKEDFSGYHNFAVDYDTHKANAKRYQEELNRRGI